jgi:hypothetical protein
MKKAKKTLKGISFYNLGSFFENIGSSKSDRAEDAF